MRDDLGVLRRDFPHSLQCVAGTQVDLDLIFCGFFSSLLESAFTRESCGSSCKTVGVLIYAG